jgi:hypothetical protein
MVVTLRTRRRAAGLSYKYHDDAGHSTQAHINGYGGAAAAFPPPGGGAPRRGVLAGGHDQRLPLP